MSVRNKIRMFFAVQGDYSFTQSLMKSIIDDNSMNLIVDEDPGILGRWTTRGRQRRILKAEHLANLIVEIVVESEINHVGMSVLLDDCPFQGVSFLDVT